MTALAPTLQAFFTSRLTSQRPASPNTVAAYRDAWRLMLRYAQDRTSKQPCQLDLADLADLDAPFVAGFLDHLERDRGNSVRTRNARLAAIRSFFSYAALCHPEHAGLIARVLAIPAKKARRNELCYLNQPEADALLAAPDRSTWTGRRDHALLDVAADTGLRVSELTGLRNRDIQLGAGAHVSCEGKGRKHRSTPLRKQTAAVLAAWMNERGGRPDDPLFPTRRGTPISRGAVGRLVAKHAAAAARRCSSLRAKKITPLRAPSLLRHVLAGTRRGHRSDRAVDGSRAGRDHPDLRPRRHDDQGTGARPDGAAQHRSGALPAARLSPGVPHQPVIMRTTPPARGPPDQAQSPRTPRALHNPGGSVMGQRARMSQAAGHPDRDQLPGAVQRIRRLQ